MKIIDRIRSAFGIRPPQARRFSAAQLNRLTSGWSTLNVSANSDLRMDLEALRARSRDLANNNDYAGPLTLREFLRDANWTLIVVLLGCVGFWVWVGYWWAT